jgi:hypothetical protein
MDMRYKLIAVPEFTGPDEGMNGAVYICTLPEGTYGLNLDAHWHVNDPDGRFRGGARSYEWRKT